MVNVGLLFAWSCMCLVEDMINTLDDCDLLEKVVYMTNVRDSVKYNNSDLVMQNMHIIIVLAPVVQKVDNAIHRLNNWGLVFCVNAMAINVSANQAESP